MIPFLGFAPRDHQYTKEPGSAFYGPHGTLPGDPGASTLFRTVDFIAVNNIFVPDANTAISWFPVIADDSMVAVD